MDDGAMARRPNILLIMADQLVPFLTGAYGHPVVRTPNLDRLVEQGVRFDSAYTPCPICAPARASMMTGRYASRLRCYDNAAPLSSDVPTIAHYLAFAGYECVASGKLHHVGPDQLHGFQGRLTPDIYPASFEWAASRTHEDRTAAERAPHARSYAIPNGGGRAISATMRERTFARASTCSTGARSQGTRIRSFSVSPTTIRTSRFASRKSCGICTRQPRSTCPTIRQRWSRHTRLWTAG